MDQILDRECNAPSERFESKSTERITQKLVFRPQGAGNILREVPTTSLTHDFPPLFK
jgi:hypothetical protein